VLGADLVEPVRLGLSQVSSALVGAVATLELPDGKALPGDTVRVRAVLENTGSSTLTGLDATINSDDGWNVTRVGGAANELRPGDRAELAYDVTVPADQRVGLFRLTGEAVYRLDGAVVSLPVGGDLEVKSPLVLADVSAEPSAVAPGGTATVRAVVRDEASVTAGGSVSIRLPDGWHAEPVEDLVIERSGEHAVEVTVTAGREGTAGPVAAALALRYAGDTVAESTVPLRFDLVTPPETAMDHVDLGNPTSEQAHDLVASPTSGTNVEAGLTRRYTYHGVAGAYFEFDLEVEPGQLFALRAIETYGRRLVDTQDQVCATRRERPRGSSVSRTLDLEAPFWRGGFGACTSAATAAPGRSPQRQTSSPVNVASRSVRMSR
jgi:hypothetical protein